MFCELMFLARNNKLWFPLVSMMKRLCRWNGCAYPANPPLLLPERDRGASGGAVDVPSPEKCLFNW